MSHPGFGRHSTARGWFGEAGASLLLESQRKRRSGLSKRCGFPEPGGGGQRGSGWAGGVIGAPFSWGAGRGHIRGPLPMCRLQCEQRVWGLSFRLPGRRSCWRTARDECHVLPVIVRFRTPTRRRPVCSKRGNKEARAPHAFFSRSGGGLATGSKNPGTAAKAGEGGRGRGFSVIGASGKNGERRWRSSRGQAGVDKGFSRPGRFPRPGMHLVGWPDQTRRGAPKREMRRRCAWMIFHVLGSGVWERRGQGTEKGGGPSSSGRTRTPWFDALIAEEFEIGIHRTTRRYECLI